MVMTHQLWSPTWTPKIMLHQLTQTQLFCNRIFVTLTTAIKKVTFINYVYCFHLVIILFFN